jgi:hypothetical protein
MESIDRLKDLTSEAETKSQGDIAQLAMLQTVRGMTDVLERIAGHQERTDQALQQVAESMHGMDKRLALMETDTAMRRVEALELPTPALKAELDSRVKPLELAEHGRTVERGLASS